MRHLPRAPLEIFEIDDLPFCASNGIRSDEREQKNSDNHEFEHGGSPSMLHPLSNGRWMMPFPAIKQSSRTGYRAVAQLQKL
jgi:hypothetical protein